MGADPQTRSPTPGEWIATSTSLTPSRASPYVVVWILVLVLTQRFAIPLGGVGQQVPATIPAMLLVVCYGLARGHVILDRRRAALLGATLVALSLLTVVATVRGLEPSLLSFLLFLTIYPVALADLLDPRAARRGLNFFVDLMLVAAVVGLVLFGLQYAGLPYADHLGRVVPPELLLTGYNTADPIQFGSSLFRSNGVVFLEPSFFSLFLGLAVVISLVMRRRLLLLPLLLGGIAVTTAGNGVAMILVSVVWLVLVGRWRRLLALVPSAAVAVAAASLTPLGALFVQRSSEIGAENSSASLRLVQPYTELFPAYVASPVTALLGAGAGSAQRLIEAQVGSLAVIVPAAPKLLVEYGWLGAVPAMVFLVHLLLARVRQAPWAPALLVVFLVVNAGLLQPTLAFVVVTFCATLVPPAARSGRDLGSGPP